MFAIYHAKTAETFAPHYFTRPAWNQPGHSRRACAPVLASMPQKRSYMVVRENVRKCEMRLHWQHYSNHTGPRRSYRDSFSVKSTNWLAVSMAWEGGHIEVLGSYQSRPEAIAAVRQLHKTAGQVPCQD